MKTVIYLDVLLLVNFIVGYFLLLAAGLLSGCTAGISRLLPASLLASLSSLILFAPELSYPLQLMYKFISGGCIILAAFGFRSFRRFFCTLFWYVALNLLLAGLSLLAILQTGVPFIQTNNLAVYLRISPLVLLLLAGLCCLAIEIILRVLPLRRKHIQSIGLELDLCGTKICLRAMLDTGCHLSDPITCLPVLLVSFPDAETRLPQSVRDFLAAWFEGSPSDEPPEGLRLRLIPCTTAADSSILPGFSTGKIGLISSNGILPLDRTAVAFSRQSFGSESYEALYGPDFL